MIAVEAPRPLWKVVSACVLIAGSQYPFEPLVHRQLKLPQYQITHVDSPIRKVILHIVDLMQESAPIRFANSREPGLVPRSGHIGEGPIALIAPLANCVQSLIQSRRSLLLLIVFGVRGGSRQRAVDPAKG